MPPAAGGRGRLIAGAVVAIGAGGMAGLLLLRSLRAAPDLPADFAHAAAAAAPQCLECHGPDGARPRSRNHPLSDRCFDCHDRR